MRSVDRRWAVLGGLLLTLAACKQDPENPDGTGPDGIPGPGGLVENSLECLPGADEQRGISTNAMRRLSRDELTLTLRDLLGEALYEDAEIAPRVQGLPSDQVLVPGDFSLSPPVGLAGVLNQIAEHVAGVAETDTDWRRDYLHACAETLPLTDDCLLDVIDAWGARVWRRPLTADEFDDYAAFTDEWGGGERGLNLLLRRTLQGPSLVFHIEEGTGGDRQRATPPHRLRGRRAHQLPHHGGATRRGALRGRRSGRAVLARRGTRTGRAADRSPVQPGPGQ